MPIDPQAIVWDDEVAAPPMGPDPRAVQWDDDYQLSQGETPGFFGRLRERFTAPDPDQLGAQAVIEMQAREAGMTPQEYVGHRPGALSARQHPAGVAWETAKAVPHMAVQGVGGMLRGAQVLGDLATGTDRPLEEGLLHRAGENLSRTVEDRIPMDPDYQGNFLVDVGGGMGSMGTFLAGGAVGRGLAGVGSRALNLGQRGANLLTQAGQFGAAGTMAGASGVDEAMHHIKDFNQQNPDLAIPEDEARKIAALGIGPGVVQIANIGVILRRIPANLRGSATTYMVRRMLEAGASEFTVETAGAVLQDALRSTYDENHEVIANIEQHLRERGSVAGASAMALQAMMFPAMRSGTQARTMALREKIRDGRELSGDDLQFAQEVGFDAQGEMETARKEGLQRQLRESDQPTNLLRPQTLVMGQEVATVGGEILPTLPTDSEFSPELVQDAFQATRVLPLTEDMAVPEGYEAGVPGGGMGFGLQPPTAQAGFGQADAPAGPPMVAPGQGMDPNMGMDMGQFGGMDIGPGAPPGPGPEGVGPRPMTPAERLSLFRDPSHDQTMAAQAFGAALAMQGGREMMGQRMGDPATMLPQGVDFQMTPAEQAPAAAGQYREHLVAPVREAAAPLQAQEMDRATFERDFAQAVAEKDYRRAVTIGQTYGLPDTEIQALLEQAVTEAADRAQWMDQSHQEFIGEPMERRPMAEDAEALRPLADPALIEAHETAQAQEEARARRDIDEGLKTDPVINHLWGRVSGKFDRDHSGAYRELTGRGGIGRSFFRQGGISLDEAAQEINDRFPGYQIETADDLINHLLTTAHQRSEKGGAMFKTAYHGTPHTFAPEKGFPHGRFRLDKMGTGEGAQAFGWGVYLAQAKETGQAYKDVLSPGKRNHHDDIWEMGVTDVTNSVVDEIGETPSPKEIKEYAVDAMKEVGANEGGRGQEYSTKLLGIVEGMNENLFEIKNQNIFYDGKPYETAVDEIANKSGSLYTLDIPDAVMPKLLDWDKQLSEQSAYVAERLERAGLYAQFAGKTGQEIYQELTKMSWRPGKKGLPGIEQRGPSSKDAMASEYLASLGIPGHQYLDHGSRATTGGEILEVKKGTDGKWRSKIMVRNRAGVGFTTPADVSTTSMPFNTEAEARTWAEGKIGEGTHNYVIWDQPTLDQISLLERNEQALEAMQAARNQGRGEQPSTVQAETLSQSFNALVQSRYPGLKGRVVVAENEAGLPAELQRVIQDQAMEGEFYGVHWRGKIYFPASNIETSNAAQATFLDWLLRHEGRHMAWDDIFGGAGKRRTFFQRAARAFEGDVTSWLKKNGMRENATNRAIAAEEVMADHMRQGTVHRIIDELIAKVMEWARKAFPDLNLTKAEVRAILSRADQYIESTGDTPAFLGSMAGAQFSQPINQTPGADDAGSRIQADTGTDIAQPDTRADTQGTGSTPGRDLATPGRDIRDGDSLRRGVRARWERQLDRVRQTANKKGASDKDRARLGQVTLSEEFALSDDFLSARELFRGSGYEVIPIASVPWGGVVLTDQKTVLLADARDDGLVSYFAHHELEHVKQVQNDKAALDLVGRVNENSEIFQAYSKALGLTGEALKQELAAAKVGSEASGIPMPSVDAAFLDGEAEPRYLFAGQRATTTNQATLTQAQEMQGQGASREDVWKETGWWQGPDGQWRFEIDDSQVGFDYSKVSDFPYSEENLNAKLKDVVSAPGVSQAYPFLGDIKIMNSNMAGERGGYMPAPDGGMGTITVNKPEISEAEAKSVVLHEIQHVIQEHEGFSQGGNPRDTTRGYKSLVRDMKEQIEAIDEQLKRAEGTPRHQMLMKNRSELVEEIQSIEEADGLGTERRGHQEYQRLTGEAEARLTQRRMDMTPAQRAETPPWITLDNMLREEGLMAEGQQAEDVLINRGGGGMALSMASEAKGFPDYPDTGNKYDGDLDGLMKAMDQYNKELAEWVKTAPDMIKFRNKALKNIKVVHKNVIPGEGPWRVSTFSETKDGVIPIGHSAHKTKLEAVKEADGGDKPDDSIRFARKPKATPPSPDMTAASQALKPRIAASQRLNQGRAVNSMGLPAPHNAGGSGFSATTGEFAIEDAKIDTTTKSLLKLIGMVESAPDKLRRGQGLDGLAKTVENYFDTYEKRIGQINGTLRPVFKAMTDKKAAMRDFEKYQRAKENGRATEARNIRDSASADGKALIAAWEKLADETGRINQTIQTPYGVGMKVYDPKIKGYRTIGKGNQFFPRTNTAEVQAVLQNKDVDPALWNSIVDALLAAGKIKTRAEADGYLRQYFSDEVRNDYFAGIEKARGEQNPEIFYDYSWEAAARYLNRWAQRISQVEHFGQAYDKSGDWFDINLPKIRDSYTQQYVGQIRDRVYNVKPLDGYTNVMNALNMAATGFQLGNPATAFLNLVGGSTMNVQMYGLKNVARAYKELLSDWSRVQQSGTSMGILGKDVLNILKDADRDSGRYFEDKAVVNDALAKFASFTMKWGGYTGTENIIRATGMLAAKNWLHDSLRAVNANPKSGRAKKFYRWMQTENLNAEALILENGAGAETAKFLRRAVNIPQGSYRIDMTPIYTDSPMGRFLFKYQKFGTQLSRMFWRHHLKPFMASVAGGTKVQVAATGETVRAREFMNLARFFVAAWGGGTLISMGRAAVFGYQDPGPELEDVEKALQNEDTGRAWGLIFSRAWHSMNAAGALGFYGNYAQFGLDWRDQQRTKNPLTPPGLASIDAVVELGSRWREQGRITKRDLDEISESTLALFRAYKRMSLTGLDKIGTEFNEVQLFAAKKEMGYVRKQARRYAADNDIESRRQAPGGRFAKTPMSPANRDVNNALLLGDVERARLIIQKQLGTATTRDERDSMVASFKAAARSRQPILIAGAPSEAERVRFIRWAEKNLPSEGYQRIRRVDKQYRDAAKRIGLM